MAGRAQACGPEIPIGSTYAKFLFNPADFHMASYFPESWHSSPILSLTHISNFIWHTAHYTSMQLTKFQLLIAFHLNHRSGPAFRIKTREKEQKLNNKSGSPVNPIGPAILFLLIFIIKYVIILKKDTKTPRFQLKITRNETKQRKNLSFLI